MGDHFVLLVDRLLTESTLEAAIFESRNMSRQSIDVGADDIEIDVTSYERDSRDCSSPRKIVECRICQDEGENSNMDTPCSCCGSLKYAHRRCIQRWCNEKGNTVCEICHQYMKSGSPLLANWFGVGCYTSRIHYSRVTRYRPEQEHRIIPSNVDFTDHITYAERPIRLELYPNTNRRQQEP